jgi:hypothetical protein
LLTAQKTRNGINSNYIVEKNWELIEKLRSSRLNYGMSRKQHDLSNAQQPKSQTNEGDGEEEHEDYQPKAKHIRYNDDDDDDH